MSSSHDHQIISSVTVKTQLFQHHKINTDYSNQQTFLKLSYS